MKATWSNLPKEILYKVIRQFKDDSKTLIQLQMTCKKWQLLAQAIMYRAICLPPAEDTRASLLIESLQLPDKDYASKVMELRFSSYSTLDRNNLVQIIRLCPNVKCVKHVINKQVGDYYSLLLKLYRQGYLRNLEKVGDLEIKSQSDNDNTIMDPYIRLILELKESVKRLCIPFNYSASISLLLIRALKEFKQLEEITIGGPGSTFFTQLDQVLRDKHPLLSNLTARTLGFNANGQDNTSITISLPHIRLLNLGLKTCSAKDLQLIQLIFPALQELYINTIPSPVSFSNVDDENDTAKEDMEAFFGFVWRTKAFQIGIGSLDTNSLEHMIRIASKKLQIFSVSINVTPNSTLSTLYISTAYSGYKGQQTTHTKEGKPICHVRIIMAPDQRLENSCQSLLKVLADVNPRSIKIEDYENYPMDIISRFHKSVFGSHIDYILTQFKDLKALKLSNMSFAMEASASPTVTKPLELEELEILNCKVPALFFEQLSRKINYIKVLNIGSIICSDFSSLNGLSMPYTRLQILRLDKNLKSCKLSISLNAASAHLCLDASGFPKPATCFNICDFSKYSLRCISLSELEATSHRMLLRSNNGRIAIFQEIKF